MRTIIATARVSLDGVMQGPRCPRGHKVMFLEKGKLFSGAPNYPARTR